MTDVQKARFLDVRLIVEEAMDQMDNGLGFDAVMADMERRIAEFVKVNVFEVTLESTP